MNSPGRRAADPERTLTVVGPGLIGGSLIRAVRAAKLPYRIAAVARREETRRLVRESGAADEIFADVTEAARTADLVVLALPVRALPEVFARMAPGLRAGTVVTDVGSTKGRLLERLGALLPPGVALVGGHPIAGTEDSGFESSFPELFRGARCILTPGDSSTPEGVQIVRSLWEGVGCRIEIMDAALHDRIFAVISHLPHVVAYALVNAAAEADDGQPGLLAYTGGGFRDFTRIAASHAEMWRDICLDNREEILAAIDLFGRELQSLRDHIGKADGPGLEAAFRAARSVRRSLSPPADSETD